MTTIPQNFSIAVSNSNPVAHIKDEEKIVIGQLGQTLDGYIATISGESKYINSQCGLKHLHALRSAVDAVIIGVESVNEDNPELTVRLCNGAHPVRVIIDPSGRVDLSASVFSDDKADVIVITCEETPHPAKDIVSVVPLPSNGTHIQPETILDALNDLGYMRILVEGGKTTLSHFLDGGMLDRLHLIVAPMIMGGGTPGLSIGPIEHLKDAIRPRVTLYPLGRDVIYDCDLKP